MAASMTRWRRACWARVSGRATVCSIPTAYPHRHLGLRERGHYAGLPCQDGAPGAGGRHRRPGRVRRAGGHHRRPGARRTGPPDPPTPARRHGRAPDDHLVAVGQGHRHRAAGPDVAGDLLPVLRQRRAGHPRCWPRAWSTRPPQLAELVGGDWSEDASWDTALRGDRGVPRLLGGQPGRLPGGRPGHRGGRRRAARHPGAGAQRRHRGPGPGHRGRVALARGGPGRGPTSLARRRRPYGRGRHAGGHVRQRVGPPLRLRVLGHPHRATSSTPRPACCTGRSPGRPAPHRPTIPPPCEADDGRGPGPCWAAPRRRRRARST